MLQSYRTEDRVRDRHEELLESKEFYRRDCDGAGPHTNRSRVIVGFAAPAFLGPAFIAAVAYVDPGTSRPT